MKQFRIYAKRLFLTFSQVNPEITVNHILEQLQSKYQLGQNFQYVISKEYHQDGGTHFHVVVIQQKKINIVQYNTLNIKYKEKNFHGNYQPIKSLAYTIEYICKGNDYITNIENLQDGKLLSAKQFIVNQVQEKGVNQALSDYYKRSTEKAIAGVSLSTLRKHFNDVEKLETALQQDQVDTPFTLDNFDTKGTIQEWLDNPNTTLLLLGRSGLGKTQFMKALTKDKALKTLFVNHKEDFKRLNSTYDSIMIDDANLHELSETELLSIIENRTNRTIRVLYGIINKKANTLQIIAMNNREFLKIKDILSQVRFARRITVHQPKEPFMVNIFYQNIDNSQNTHNIHNHHPDFSVHQKEELRRAQQTQRKILEISQQEHLD